MPKGRGNVLDLTMFECLGQLTKTKHAKTKDNKYNQKSWKDGGRASCDRLDESSEHWTSAGTGMGKSWELGVHRGRGEDLPWESQTLPTASLLKAEGIAS